VNKNQEKHFCFSWFRLERSDLAGTHLGEALAAVNRAIALGLERNTSLTAAGGAGGGKEFPGTTGRILAGVTAGLAALGLILEASLRVELLLTGSKHELLSTFLAYKGLVFEHCESSLLMNDFP